MDPQAPTPSDQYATLKSAVLGAQVNTAPGASPLGNFPEIARLYSSAPQVEQAHLKDSGNSFNTGVTADNARAAQQAAAQAAAQKLKDLQDPSKYQQVQKPDGGYAFYDPAGNEISASQFAAVHNTTPNEVLKHSQNPIDIAYQQDFNNLQTYINAKLRSGNNVDQKQVADDIAVTVKNSTGIDINKMNPQQLIQQFRASYPTVYGGTGRGVSASRTFIPNAKDVNGS